MKTTRSRLQDSSPAPRGVAGDIHRLKRDGAASVAELREFVSGLRGKSPQEVLGVMSGSGLVQGMLLSTAAFAAVIAVFTVVPYVLGGGAKPNAKSATAAPVAKTQDIAKTRPAAPAKTDANAVASKTGGAPDVKSAAKTLKIDEVKGTNPNDAPDIDDILNKKFE